MPTTLPVNIDTTYADSASDASVALHQQHHDALHGTYNAYAPTVGHYYWSSNASVSTAATMGNGSERAYPVYLRAGTLDRLGVSVGTVGQAGSLIRLGVRLDAGGYPGNLLADAGTVAGDVANTLAQATIATAIPTAGWYWLTATVQAAGTTQPTLYVVSGAPGHYLPLTTATATAPTFSAGPTTCLINATATVSGALPTAWTATGMTTGGTCARFVFRYSA